MRGPYIRFGYEHVDPILDGEKRVTARVEFERDLSPGDRVALLDEDGDEFADATIEWVGEMTAARFVQDDWNQHRSYRSIGQFLDELRSYYPDADLYPGTRVDVIKLEDVEEREDYRQQGPVRTDGGVVTDRYGFHAPAEADGVNLREEGCPACGCGIFLEAGNAEAERFSCEDCNSTWEGDPEDAELVVWWGDTPDLEDDEPELLSDGGRAGRAIGDVQQFHLVEFTNTPERRRGGW